MPQLDTSIFTNNTMQSPASENPISAGRQDEHCPVVAIGVSDESLSELAGLLENLSPTLGMAYIIIQNIPIHGIPILPATLTGFTSMPVCKGEAGMRILMNMVYVLAPESNLTLREGILAPMASLHRKENSYPIDAFLSGLAANYKEKAIAVILSGKTNDGCTGIHSICREGGLTFAIDGSAAFPQMPELAAQSGFIDVTGSPSQIAERLTRLAGYFRDIASPLQLEEDRKDLGAIYLLLLERHKFDFSFFKQNLIERRIRRRMTLHGLQPLGKYLEHLRNNCHESDLLYKDLLLDIKGFFREPALYQSLIKTVLPALLKGRAPDDPVRVWIPACNTGEAAWSLAICLLEYWGEKKIGHPLLIFATDNSQQAIAEATKGIYASASMQNISERRIRQFFEHRDNERSEKEFQVNKTLRDLCVFTVHNLLKDPPFPDIDLICCENATVRMGPIARDQVMAAFYHALKSSGYLLPGKLDKMPDDDSPFTLHESVWRVYSKKNKDRD